jgi:subtilisin family serine protease
MTPMHPRRARPSAGSPRMCPGVPPWSALVMLLVLLCLPAPPASGGVLHENLVRLLNTAGKDQPVRGLLLLDEQLDLPALEREMEAQGVHTRAERHEIVVKAAQELAQRTQQPLIAELADLTSRGEVLAYEPFWVANMVAVESKPSGFLRLSLRGDVGVIYADDPILPRYDENERAVTDSEWIDHQTEIIGDLASLSSGLTAINVQPAWDLGYTGTGRLVCTFDSGADGDHPTLAARWRGIQSGSSWDQAWRDPYGGTTYPYDSAFHGTHVLGIITAQPTSGEAVGVAPDAQWMSAGALIGWNATAIISCYQWAADPDGNPSTLWDVPDVINNSWGTSDDCSSLFWAAIDLVEAAGIVNVISVDNSGPAAGSVNSPESRATGPYVNFGVGNVDSHTPGYPISSSSGRGPSPCDGTSIKPNVVAPGTDIRSTLPGGGFGSMTGTSQAAPYVSGAAALLRQLNPELTVEQVKMVLAATATDLGPSGPDNAYGWGMINVGAAVNYVLANLPPSPPPRSLSAQVLPDSGVALTWLAPDGIVSTNNLTGYRVYRAPDAQGYPSTPLVTLGPSITQVFDPVLTYGTYRYVVRATYENETESGPSNEAIAEVRDPAGLAGRAPGEGGDVLTACPNPFRAWTELRYRTASEGRTGGAVEIFDASGRRVRRLAVEPGAPGRVLWDGRGDGGAALPAGAYFARPAGPGRPLQRMILLK